MAEQGQADGVDSEIPQFAFSEEALGLPAYEGFGFFQGGPGDELGPGRRFKLAAKLGSGTTASVWLARDTADNSHVAIKILNGYATGLNFEGKLCELLTLLRLSSGHQNDHCPRLLSHFHHPGIEDDGRHLCLVLELLGCNMQALLLEVDHLPPPTVKRVLRHVLLGLQCLHSHGIAHTDLKPDNIMVDLGSSWTADAIESWIFDHPPRTYPPERSLKKMVTAFVTESFPLPDLHTLSSHNFKVTDLSAAQFVSRQTTDSITPLGLRAPEVVLGGEWNESVDIWAFGCMIFTILTKRPLFVPEPYPEADASEIDVLLYRMITLCGEFFDGPLLQRCPLSKQYFNPDCRPKKFSGFQRKTFQECISESKFSPGPADVEGAAALMHRCLRLDPKDRATASELLDDPWLK